LNADLLSFQGMNKLINKDCYNVYLIKNKFINQIIFRDIMIIQKANIDDIENIIKADKKIFLKYNEDKKIL